MEHETPRGAGQHEVIQGSCIEALEILERESIDAVVTDPPYAIDSSSTDQAMLGMQSQNWNEKATHSRGYADNDPIEFQAWCTQWLTKAFRVLRPGGHLVAFGGTRTWHRLAVAAEDVGFEVRDTIAWIHGSGRPKTGDLGRIVRHRDPSVVNRVSGRSTTLTPVYEPAILVRKPIIGTVLSNVLQHGTGALDIDGTRLPDGSTTGRWPSNAIVEDTLLHELDAGSSRSLYPALRVSKPTHGERVKVDGVGHPTVKPLDLMRFLVRLVTPEHGVVLDPFAGSGTTAEAALLEHRRSINIEREPSYIPLIHARLARRERPLDALEVQDVLPFGA